MTHKNRVLILADDLTGANDTAIQFVKHGLSSLLVIHSALANPLFFDDYHVVSVNSNSRGMKARDAYNTVRRTIEQLGSGYFVYKKVDSVLRGNPGEELAAVMDALGIPLAIAAPSFPANRSVVRKGILYAGEKSDSDGVNAVKIFADGTGRKTENIPLGEIRQGSKAVIEFIKTHNDNGTQVFVADAVIDEDLETVCEASVSLGKPHIVAGSAGLAYQCAVAKQFATAKSFAEFAGKTSGVSFEKASALPSALVVAGTRQRETTAQIINLSRAFAVPVIKFKTFLVYEGRSEQAIDEAFNEASEHMKQNAPVCIVAADSLFESAGAVNDTEGNEISAAISAAIGILTGKLIDSFGFPLIIGTGGNTSLGICQQLGVDAIEPLAEISPGIPLGRIIGGSSDGRYIVTKSGRFGTPDVFTEIMNYTGVNRSVNQ